MSKLSLTSLPVTSFQKPTHGNLALSILLGLILGLLASVHLLGWLVRG